MIARDQITAHPAVVVELQRLWNLAEEALREALTLARSQGFIGDDTFAIVNVQERLRRLPKFDQTPVDLRERIGVIEAHLRFVLRAAHNRMNSPEPDLTRKTFVICPRLVALEFGYPVVHQPMDSVEVWPLFAAFDRFTPGEDLVFAIAPTRESK
jgi:hypothetical protein